VEDTLAFPVLLRLIDERAAAFRAAIAAAPSLDAPVPTCPEWSVRDLARHLGVQHRSWGITVATGPSDERPAEAVAARAETAPPDREELLAWSAESTKRMLDALREAGPERGCWTAWGDTQSLSTAGGVARHQVQEVAVHTYDAQVAVGTAQPLPDDVALDGVEEFIFSCNTGPYRWPFGDNTIEYRAAEGRSWRLSLSTDGIWATRLTQPSPTPADVTASASAGDLILCFYGRLPLDVLRIEGNAKIIEQIAEWEPEVSSPRLTTR
jgi:uncharacterized protein (TIGR03083 family)